MIPDYLTFIRYQDKRTFAFIFLVLLVTLAFYWRNTAFAFTAADTPAVSLILAITLFNFISELKPYWMYTAALDRVNLQFFIDKTCSAPEKVLVNPLVMVALSMFVFWLLMSICLLLPSSQAVFAFLLLTAQVFICLVYRLSRSLIIRWMAVRQKKSPDRYLTYYIRRHTMLLFVVSLLSITPLKSSADFSLAKGFLSPALVVAMLILFGIVLGVNMAFSLPSKRYIFFGRLLGDDIELTASYRLPCAGLWTLPLPVKLPLLIILQFLWIITVGMLLTVVGAAIPFEIYYLLCSLPMLGYFYCYLWWRWHGDFMLAYDMYFRYNALKKMENEENQAVLSSG